MTVAGWHPLIPILSSVALGVAGQLVLKSGIVGLVERDRRAAASYRLYLAAATSSRIWLGFALYAVSLLLWLVALSLVDLSYAYPFLSLSYALVLAGSGLALREEVSTRRLLGVIAICLGVAVVATG